MWVEIYGICVLWVDVLGRETLCALWLSIGWKMFGNNWWLGCFVVKNWRKDVRRKMKDVQWVYYCICSLWLRIRWKMLEERWKMFGNNWWLGCFVVSMDVRGKRKACALHSFSRGERKDWGWEFTCICGLWVSVGRKKKDWRWELRAFVLCG